MLVVLHHPGPASQAQPREPRPVVVVVVDQHLDTRVALNIAKPRQVPRRLRFVVDSRVELIAVQREADRDEPRRAVGPDRREPRDGALL